MPLYLLIFSLDFSSVNFPINTAFGHSFLPLYTSLSVCSLVCLPLCQLIHVCLYFFFSFPLVSRASFSPSPSLTIPPSPGSSSSAADTSWGSLPAASLVAAVDTDTTPAETVLKGKDNDYVALLALPRLRAFETRKFTSILSLKLHSLYYFFLSYFYILIHLCLSLLYFHLYFFPSLLFCHSRTDAFFSITSLRPLLHLAPGFRSGNSAFFFFF